MIFFFTFVGKSEIIAPTFDNKIIMGCSKFHFKNSILPTFRIQSNVPNPGPFFGSVGRGRPSQSHLGTITNSIVEFPFVAT